MAKSKKSTKKSHGKKTAAKKTNSRSTDLRKKELKIYALQLSAVKGERERKLTPRQVSLLVQGILSLDRSSNAPFTRYEDVAEPKIILQSGDLEGSDLSIPDFNGFTSACILRQRLGDRPWKDDGERSVFQIDLEGRNVFAEASFLLIDDSTGIVFWQYHKFVSGWNGFANYLTDRWKAYQQKRGNALTQEEVGVWMVPARKETGHPEAGHFRATPIANRDALEQFYKELDSVKLFKFRINADSAMSDELIDDSHSIADRLKGASGLTRELTGHTVEIIIKPPRADTLKVNPLRRGVRRIIDACGSSLEAAQAKGKIDNSSLTIDLLGDRLKIQREIHYSGPYPPTEKIFDALKDAHDEMSNKIEKSHGTN